MAPEQILFGYLLETLQDKGYDVYDCGFPPEGVNYPFIVMGDTQIVDKNRKGVVQGVVYQTLHVWHDRPEKRGTVSSVALDIKKICRELENTSGWNMASCSEQVLADNVSAASSQPLVHSIIEVGMEF